MMDNLGNLLTQATSRLTSTKIKISLAMYLCLYLLLTGGVAGQLTDPDEVKALQSIKNSLIDPDGNLVRWNEKDPCGSNYWREIVCYDRTFDDGYLHVKELSLLHKNLSGTLSPEVYRLSYLIKLDVMWNNISGTIPKEIGLITTLKLLLLNGNQLTGSLPEELSNLSNLDRLQIDENQISGPIPPSFANMKKVTHIHLNNNLLNGPIPLELSQLPILVHLTLENNNLSGPLPPELADLSSLLILQLDNNNFGGSSIPPSYGNMPMLLKLSLRNCSLQGPIPDWSNMPNIAYIDLSRNQLNESIPTSELSKNITTINLSRNNLTGGVHNSFSSLPRLQKLSLAKNSLGGSVPSTIWQNRNLNLTESLILDFQDNQFSNISGNPLVQANVTVRLRGNPMCSNVNLVNLCGPQEKDFNNTLNFTNPITCPPEACPPTYEYAPPSPTARCFCAAPVYVGYRLQSPGFLDFVPYIDSFKQYLCSGLQLDVFQLAFDSVEWQEGPRLRMYLKIFPPYDKNSNLRIFNESEVFRLHDMFGGWKIYNNQVFGPYEVLNFTLPKPYEDEFPPSRSGLSNGVLAGFILGSIAGSITLSAIVSLLIFKRHIWKHCTSSKRRRSTRISTKIDGVKGFTYNEMAMAANNFNNSTIVGQGGYGKVYRGVLANGTTVAIKRAQEGSLQGEKEFLTEIQLLSRLHHRNLVSLLGYCDEEGDQMLVYEFMPHGNLRDHLSGKCKVAMSFAMRVKIALDSAKGILYLHTEANPPLFHRDIKATNILLDSKFTAKVADFGLSRLASVPELEGDVPSHISTVVKGTPGYLDPEYFLTHKLTDKSDVYSLGVVFLEMLTGMHPISHGKNIVREVNTAYRSGMIFSVLDEQMGSYPFECVEKFIDLALKCCQDETETRPSVLEVVRELENIWLMMPKLDSNVRELMTTDSSGKVVSSPSSSSSLKHPYVSQDVSGSDLVSGVMPAIAPR